MDKHHRDLRLGDGLQVVFFQQDSLVEVELKHVLVVLAVVQLVGGREEVLAVLVAAVDIISGGCWRGARRAGSMGWIFLSRA